ncbi:MAG TPA: EVE domain-containing protein [Pirellulales bacterium]|nr:EVE domain-containing protein [Pirellulales bacterium]
MRAKKYWLLKTEPESFSIQDLQKSPRQTTCWDGVRNYQARNFLRDEFAIGDPVLFYHSSASPPAIVGTAVVVQTGYPDPTAFDPKNHHYDPKSSRENPTWYLVDIQLEQIFAAPLALPRLREVAALQEMVLLQKGSRLSVQPVRPEEFKAILKLAKESPRKQS